jgi:hypothetical protein
MHLTGEEPKEADENAPTQLAPSPAIPFIEDPKKSPAQSSAESPVIIQYFPSPFSTSLTYRVPYSRLPTVQRISQLGTTPLSEFQNNDSCNFVAAFARPAFFCRPIPGAYNEFYEDDGVRIIEGMTVKANNKGEYDLSCIVCSPAIPVKLKLAFQIYQVNTFIDNEADMLDIDFDGTTCLGQLKGVITIPEINLIPTESERRSQDEIHWQVTHHGHSHALQRLLAESPPNSVRLLRSGKAHFPVGNSSSY